MTNRQPSLKQLYSSELQAILRMLEEKRVLLRQRVQSVLLLIVPLMVIFGWLLLQWLGAFLGLIIALAVVTALFKRPYEEYRKQFKHQVIQRLVKYHKPDLVYNAIAGIPKEEFVSSKIFTQSIDRYHCEDLLKGKVGATLFRSSEVQAEHKSGDDMKTVFQGLFFVANFNKSFNGHTVVNSNVFEQVLGVGKGGSRTRQKQLYGLSVELVQLEDPEFTRLFTVFSTDQVEARYILSTSLMQRLIDFLNFENGRPTLASKVGVHLAFLRSKVYIAIPSTKPYFEPPSLWAKSNQQTLRDMEGYLADIKLAEEIIDDLNLNRRIWGKR